MNWELVCLVDLWEEHCRENVEEIVDNLETAQNRECALVGVLVPDDGQRGGKVDGLQDAVDGENSNHLFFGGFGFDGVGLWFGWRRAWGVVGVGDLPGDDGGEEKTEAQHQMHH